MSEFGTLSNQELAYLIKQRETVLQHARRELQKRFTLQVLEVLGLGEVDPLLNNAERAKILIDRRTRLFRATGDGSLCLDFNTSLHTRDEILEALLDGSFTAQDDVVLKLVLKIEDT